MNVCFVPLRADYFKQISFLFLDRIHKQNKKMEVTKILKFVFNCKTNVMLLNCDEISLSLKFNNANVPRNF